MAKKDPTDLSVEEKLKTLYQLQTTLSAIDEKKALRGELPLEVQDLEDDIAGLNTRVEKIKGEIEDFQQAVKAELDKSIDENLNLSFSQLKDKSHDSAWAKAYNGNGRRVMDDYSIALAAGADESTLRYILEQEELCKALA